MADIAEKIEKKFKSIDGHTLWSNRGVIIAVGRRCYIDLEFGQIYGSYRRDFVPVEVGVLLHDRSNDNIIVRGEKFDFDGDLVMRKNSIDSLGNPVGLEERVYHPLKNLIKPFDPKFRIGRAVRGNIEKRAYDIFDSLRSFINRIRKDHDMEELVFFGGQEDLNLLSRAGVDLTDVSKMDLQKEIRPYLGVDLSLDKASLIIRYGTEGRVIMSKHFKYHIPGKFQPLLKPHKAIGDAARTFLLDRELQLHRKYLINTAKDHLRKIERYRSREEEIPIF